MRSAASCCQPRQESSVPRGARTVRGSASMAVVIESDWNRENADSYVPADEVGQVKRERGAAGDRPPFEHFRGYHGRMLGIVGEPIDLQPPRIRIDDPVFRHPELGVSLALESAIA